jgi:hypothetical protein
LPEANETKGERKSPLWGGKLPKGDENTPSGTKNVVFLPKENEKVGKKKENETKGERKSR